MFSDFVSSGMLTIFSGAKQKNGFWKNPLSIFFSKSFKHLISSKLGSPHELERNHQLIQKITDSEIAPTRLYPSQHDYAFHIGI